MGEMKWYHVFLWPVGVSIMILMGLVVFVFAVVTDDYLERRDFAKCWEGCHEQLEQERQKQK